MKKTSKRQLIKIIKDLEYGSVSDILRPIFGLDYALLWLLDRGFSKSDLIRLVRQGKLEYEEFEIEPTENLYYHLNKLCRNKSFYPDLICDLESLPEYVYLIGDDYYEDLAYAPYLQRDRINIYERYDPALGDFEDYEPFGFLHITVE